MGKQRADPFGGPRPFVSAVDMAQRLEGNGIAALIVLAAKPERMMCTAHRQHRGARRKTFVEDINLRASLASELGREQPKQHRLARARPPDAPHVAPLRTENTP